MPRSSCSANRRRSPRQRSGSSCHARAVLGPCCPESDERVCSSPQRFDESPGPAVCPHIGMTGLTRPPTSTSPHGHESDVTTIGMWVTSRPPRSTTDSGQLMSTRPSADLVPGLGMRGRCHPEVSQNPPQNSPGFSSFRRIVSGFADSPRPDSGWTAHHRSARELHLCRSPQAGEESVDETPAGPALNGRRRCRSAGRRG